ncbi:MAG: BRO-N domain-containing protein [Bacteroidales bacterium]
MKQDLFVFKPSGKAIRAIVIGGEPQFVAKDVCEALGLLRWHSSVALLSEDEKGSHTMVTLGGKQKVLMVNESGMYALIFQSRKKEAVDFRKWVTSEVLPSIRKQGSYFINQERTLDGEKWKRYDVWLAQEGFSPLSSSAGKRKRDCPEGFLKIGHFWYINKIAINRYTPKNNHLTLKSL